MLCNRNLVFFKKKTCKCEWVASVEWRVNTVFVLWCCVVCSAAVRAREAHEIYCRPSIRLMFNNSHNVTKRFPSRCFVIKSAGLTVPRIFSILSSWFSLSAAVKKYFVSMCLIAPPQLRRANRRAAAASVQIRT